jgi:hypothetical protein
MHRERHARTCTHMHTHAQRETHTCTHTHTNTHTDDTHRTHTDDTHRTHTEHTQRHTHTHYWNPPLHTEGKTSLNDLPIFPKDLPIFLVNSLSTSISLFAVLLSLPIFQVLVIWHSFMTQIRHTNSDHNPFYYSDLSSALAYIHLGRYSKYQNCST